MYIKIRTNPIPVWTQIKQAESHIHKGNLDKALEILSCIRKYEESSEILFGFGTAYYSLVKDSLVAGRGESALRCINGMKSGVYSGYNPLIKLYYYIKWIFTGRTKIRVIR